MDDAAASAELLPDYAEPPLVETVLGVQFDRLPGLTNAHLGAFWRSLDVSTWPIVSDAPLLAPQFERFEEAARWAAKSIQWRVTDDLGCRLQIKNKNNDRMIQLQYDRLHFNWLGQDGKTYPRYHEVRKGFQEVLLEFKKFVDREKLGSFRPNQWEVTYVNHIPKGTVWNSVAEWEFFAPLVAVPTVAGLIEGESFSGEWHFIIPNQHGRLHVRWEHARKSTNGKDSPELVRLTLTARGPVAPVTDQEINSAIFNGLDLGRETIVRSFKQFMSSDSNKYWKLRNDTDSK